MDERYLPYLAVSDEVLRSDPTKPFDEVMPELLGALWDAPLRDQIEQLLLDLHNTNLQP
jgi:hypothetical protein